MLTMQLSHSAVGLSNTLLQISVGKYSYDLKVYANAHKVVINRLMKHRQHGQRRCECDCNKMFCVLAVLGNLGNWGRI